MSEGGFNNGTTLGATLQCLEERAELANDTALHEAYPPSPTCKASFVKDRPYREASCRVDYRSLSSAYETRCIALGGQFHEADLRFDCKVRLEPGDSQTYIGVYNFLNVPACLGRSCSTTEFDKELAQIPPEEFSDFADENFDCMLSIPMDGGESSDSGLPIVGFAILLVLVGGAIGLKWCCVRCCKAKNNAANNNTSAAVGQKPITISTTAMPSNPQYSNNQYSHAP
jgi:hypothetical protein